VFTYLLPVGLFIDCSQLWLGITLDLTANFVQTRCTEAAKGSTVRYHTDQLGVSGSYYILFTSGVYNCMWFISAFCNLVTSSPRSLMGNMLTAALRGKGFTSGGYLVTMCFFVCLFFLFVCMVTDFSAAEKDSGMKLVRLLLLPFCWTTAAAYFRDVRIDALAARLGGQSELGAVAWWGSRN